MNRLEKTIMDMLKDSHIPVVPTTHNKDQKLNTNPHYTDDRFRQAQTIFGNRCDSPHGHKHLEYVYSDRIREWDYDRARESANIANDSDAPKNSCHWYEIYLSHYFGYTVEIEHILTGVNWSNGYPYTVFGYKKVLIDKKENGESNVE